MRNSSAYAPKIRKLISGAKASARAEEDNGKLLLRSILEEDAVPKQVSDAMVAMEKEFLDYNELRVAPIKDVEDCLGKDFPGARVKAEALNRALNAIFDHCNQLSLEYLRKKPKREVRRLLREQLKLSPYAESVVTLHGFQGHAVPVDHLLLESLKVEDMVPESAQLEDVQGFLERLVPASQALGAHEALRQFAAKTAPKVSKAMAVQNKLAREQAREQARKAAVAAAESEIAKPAKPTIPPKSGGKPARIARRVPPKPPSPNKP